MCTNRRGRSWPDPTCPGRAGPGRCAGASARRPPGPSPRRRSEPHSVRHHRRDHAPRVGGTAGLRARRLIGEAAGLGVKADELQAAVTLLSGDLPLDRVAHAERHRDELLDVAVARVDAVQPRLRRDHHVVVRASALQALAAGLAGERVDLADGDLDRVRAPVRAVEVQPHRLALVHRQQHTAVRPPRLRDPVCVVGDAADREVSQRGRQRVLAAVVGDPQCALEGDAEVRADLDLVSADGDVEHGRAPSFSLGYNGIRIEQDAQSDITETAEGRDVSAPGDRARAALLADAAGPQPGQAGRARDRARAR